MARLCHRKAVQAPRHTLWHLEAKNETLRDIKSLNGKKYIRFNSKDYLIFYQNLYVGNLLILFIGGVFLCSYHCSLGIFKCAPSGLAWITPSKRSLSRQVSQNAINRKLLVNFQATL